MSYTKKLRLLILLIAVLPPLIIISILKFSTEQKIELDQRGKIEQSVEQAKAYILSQQGRVRYNVQEIVKDSLFQNIFSKKNKSKVIPKDLLQRYNFRYLYITNDSGEIVFTVDHLQSKIKSILNIQKLHNKSILTKETEPQGTYAGLTFVSKIDSAYYIYAGIYLDQSITYLIENISDATVSIQFPHELSSNLSDEINKTEKGYQAVLLSSYNDNIVITLDFPFDSSSQLFSSVLLIVSLVTFCMIVLALLLGLYYTGKTKKEIDNLRGAFALVSEGNFDTTVMAYEKSEFSELADSFSEMVAKLKMTQNKLSTVEKIAAWETVGRKLAHEIKNPLTPISIAADDLRSSYDERLPNFDKTLYESTTTIKKEVKRMTVLLDEFVSFARMKHSELQNVEFSTFVNELSKIYPKEIHEKKLLITSDITKAIVKLDKDTLTQLCINLIKNGFESKDKAIVQISIKQIDDFLQIIFSDNGPGFTEEKLEDSFSPFETTKDNGSGLGLIICHRIVLDHNGGMILQNNKNGGGEVIITLPIT